MKKLLPYILIIVATAFVTAFIQAITYKNPIDNLITVKWGDSKYGKAFYGAEVYFIKEKKNYLVKAKIRIGRGNNYYHDCGVIGVVKSPEEAVEKYGEVTWTETGLHIGKKGTYFISRKEIESHR